MYYEETKKVMLASIAAAVLNVFLNCLFIPIFGYIAAAFTTLACYIFLAIFHFIMAKKVLNDRNAQITLFDGKTIIVISLILMIALIAFEYLYSKTVLRYSVLTVIILALFMKRRYFINLLKTVKRSKA